MSQSVVIKTPVPTLDEVGDRLGMSQARRQRLLKIVHDSKTGSFVRERVGGETLGSQKAGGKSMSLRKPSK